MTPRAVSPASAGQSGARPVYACGECGWTTPKWVGRCGECQSWGTVEERAGRPGPSRTQRPLVPTAGLASAQPIGEVPVDAALAVPTGVAELDRVLGGGLVPGAVVLLAGEPGIGKSTLLLDVAARAARTGRRVLYVTGEESASQVRLRAERIDAVAPGLLLAAETDVATVLGHVQAQDPGLLVVDSVQTIASELVDGAPGGVAQVREVAAALIDAAKTRALPVILVGHVTKDGTVAGPRTLEHLVDVVCQFEGDRHSRLRMVRAVKNRYGPTDEVGCFELSGSGIAGLADPSGLFMSHTAASAPGTCLTVTLEGRRPLALEVQGLAVPSTAATPRRTTSGVDSSRVAMILAVLHRHLGAHVLSQDVYVSTVGGARMAEPAADLAIALAVLGAHRGTALSHGLVALGEVGLSGDLRAVGGLEQRLAEAARLGFTRAVVPASAVPGQAPGITVLAAHTLAEAAALIAEEEG